MKEISCSSRNRQQTEEVSLGFHVSRRISVSCWVVFSDDQELNDFLLLLSSCCLSHAASLSAAQALGSPLLSLSLSLSVPRVSLPRTVLALSHSWAPLVLSPVYCTFFLSLTESVGSVFPHFPQSLKQQLSFSLYHSHSFQSNAASLFRFGQVFIHMLHNQNFRKTSSTSSMRILGTGLSTNTEEAADKDQEKRSNLTYLCVTKVCKWIINPFEEKLESGVSINVMRIRCESERSCLN